MRGPRPQTRVAAGPIRDLQALQRAFDPAGESAESAPSSVALLEQDDGAALLREEIGPEPARAYHDRVAVIMPATDGPATLERCHDALLAAVRPGDEIVVVTVPEHSGPATARNHGVAQSDSPLLVFVDADVEVHPDAIERLRSTLAEREDLVAVFGSYDDAPSMPGRVSVFRNLLHHHVHQENAGPVTTFWAGLGAIRREAFEAVDGFDTRYETACVEDLELGMRLVAAGGRIELDPAAQGTHLKGWTLWSMLRTDLFRRGIPWATLLLHRREAPPVLNLGWRHRLSALASMVLLGGALGRRRRPLLGAAAFLTAANHSLYRLLWRRQGPGGALTGIGLHTAHHAVGVAAVLSVLARQAGRAAARLVGRGAEVQLAPRPTGPER